MKTIERFRKCLGWVMALLMLAVTGGWAGHASGATAEGKSLGDLRAVLGDLRKGGLVIYFRHASTDQSAKGDAAADMARCDTQRNLSAKGREEAAQIGKAITALRIPVGSVLASPFCRAKDTAQLAFGRFAVSKDLHFSIGADAAEMKQLADALRRLLSTPPPPGTNSVIVSHSANLREAAGIFPKPEGVAYVFRPLPNGEFEAAARILPEDWSRVAQPIRGATAR
jgi:phosphohistidine phosphatase SixA